MNDQLARDVAALRKEASHVDVENDDFDGSHAGDGWRQLADRLEVVGRQHTALRARLAEIEQAMRAASVPGLSVVSYWADQLAALLQETP